MAGYRSLSPGQEVRFRFEAARQDGYAFRATEVWPADQAPVPPEPETPEPSAYESTLTLTFDGENSGS